MYFKSEFTNKFETFENIFQTYADVTNKSITINTNNKLSEVNEKIYLENEQKLREKKALNDTIFNVLECNNTTSCY